MNATLAAIRKLWPERSPRKSIEMMMKKIEWRKLEGREACGWLGVTAPVNFIGEFELIGGLGFTLVIDGGMVNVLLWEDLSEGLTMKIAEGYDESKGLDETDDLDA